MHKLNIVVIDYQLGNISSIINMLKKIGVKAIHSNQIADIQAADKLILPGVGAFDHGMHNLQQSSLIEVLNTEVLEKKKPILGICLGMQLLLQGSEEGKLSGLGWIKGKCIKFVFENNLTLKVPHMGWNTIKYHANTEVNANDETRYYFVHSYHAVCETATDVIATTDYGHEFPAIIGHNHILGAQFHPEKSHRFGMRFLKDFVEREV